VSYILHERNWRQRVLEMFKKEPKLEEAYRGTIQSLPVPTLETLNQRFNFQAAKHGISEHNLRRYAGLRMETWLRDEDFLLALLAREP